MTTTLQHLKELNEKATKAPWQARYASIERPNGEAVIINDTEWFSSTSALERWEKTPDAQLIVELRNNADQLIALWEAAEKASRFAAGFQHNVACNYPIGDRVWCNCGASDLAFALSALEGK